MFFLFFQDIFQKDNFICSWEIKGFEQVLQKKMKMNGLKVA